MSPKVQSYSAPWLDPSTPGAALFQPNPTDKGAKTTPYEARSAESGARRTIAHRGTEVFVAVRKEIRWGDLAYIRDRYKEAPRIKREDTPEPFAQDGGIGSGPMPSEGIRILKIPLADDIRQLVLSPNGSFLAVLTAYTVHVIVIPDPTHLSSEETVPIKPKFWTLGPTIHVTSKSPIASALWHPLGVDGHCIVTVTTDAVVRVWELSTSDRWSFDSPTLSIDLKKLVDGRSLDEDYSAAPGLSNSFSPDSVEMAVAAAAFASRGSGDWSPMTLWIAMREGDVYALCPLLPSKWAPPPTLIPSLSISVVTKMAVLEDDVAATVQEKLLAQNQVEWMGEIDKQEPEIAHGPLDRAPIEVYMRPSKPGVVPRLQGPFKLKGNPDSDDELDRWLTDIMVIGKKLDSADLMTGEDESEIELDDDLEGEGLSLTVVLALSTSGQVRAYLDVEGVQAQWLPSRKAGNASSLARTDSYSLLAFQSLDTMAPSDVWDDAWPLFSQDVMSRYNFYVSHHRGITFVSLSSWVFRLESDLQANSEAGSDFRIGLLASSRSTRDKLYDHFDASGTVPLAAAVAIRDPDLGYFLLSSTPYEPVALTFEEPSLEVAVPQVTSTAFVKQEAPTYEELQVNPLDDFYEPRPAFRPSHVFEQPSDMPALVTKLRTSRHKTMLNQEVRLSTATLQIFTEAHKVLSDETHHLGMAAAEVFRRCELLQQELRQQISKVGEVKAKVDRISGRDGGRSDDWRFKDRLARANERQDKLTARLDKMRDMVGKGPPRPLSDKERAFADELRSLEGNLMCRKDSDGALSSSSAATPRQESARLWKRLEEVKRLQVEMVEEADGIVKRQQQADVQEGDGTAAKDGGGVVGAELQSPRAKGGADLRVPSEIRKAKLQQVMGLLDRESALVEAVSARLERLQVSSSL